MEKKDEEKEGGFSLDRELQYSHEIQSMVNIYPRVLHIKTLYTCMDRFGGPSQTWLNRYTLPCTLYDMFFYLVLVAQTVTQASLGGNEGG